MDHLEDWEILDYHDQDIKKKRTSSTRKAAVFNKNYSVSPSSHNQLVPIPFQLDQDVEARSGDGVPQENIMPKVQKFPDVETKDSRPGNSQESFSQVFFKKVKDNEFVDMKLDSPTQTPSTKALLPPHQINFEDEKERSDDEEGHDGGHSGLNIWKWSLTGIGAICSFGVAAVATISVVVISNYQRNKKQQELRFQFISDDKPMPYSKDQAMVLPCN